MTIDLERLLESEIKEDTAVWAIIFREFAVVYPRRTALPDRCL